MARHANSDRSVRTGYSGGQSRRRRNEKRQRSRPKPGCEPSTLKRKWPDAILDLHDIGGNEGQRAICEPPFCSEYVGHCVGSKRIDR
jgi:hypothetical protein